MNAKECVYQMTLQKYDLFKEQNPENGRFDVVFEVEGKLLYAHRNMLTLVSDTFDSMLSDRWAPNKDQPFKIKDYSFADFYQFITFLYSGECQLTVTNIFSVVDIAEFYGVEIFKNYCDAYLADMEITTENIFSLMELADKYSMIELKDSVFAFIIGNFQSLTDSGGFFSVSKNIVKEIIAAVKDDIKPEDLFQAVYKWSEKRALVEQTNNPNLILNDQIKVEIVDFLPNIRFCEMDLDFLLEFVVPKGFIFSSLNELSKILCERKLRKKVKITNNRGQTLHGNVIPDKTVNENIESLKSMKFFFNWNIRCYWKTNYKRPTTPSPLKKREAVQWYLIYYYDGDIGVELGSSINEHDYLLAELIPGPTGFEMNSQCKIEIE